MNPKSVGVILDGNRRWAKERGLPFFTGHSEGYNNFKKFIDFARKEGVETIFAYIFSEENWKRKEEEVSFLMSLIRKIVTDDLDDFLEKDIRLIFAGNIKKFPKDIYEKMLEVEEKTKNNTFNLCLCVSYGGRYEIVNAFNQIIKDNPDKKEITIDDIESHLYTKGLADPDIIIRTSGEKRLSGFLPWQSVYSELFFIDKFWPDFSQEDFKKIIEEYKSRERRMGR